MCHTLPVPLHGGLVRPATLQVAGADGAGLLGHCRSHFGPQAVSARGANGRPQKHWAEGDTQSFREVSQDIPARRRRCGKAITPPPDASFRKTTRAERQLSSKRYYSSSPGEGPALRLPSTSAACGERHFRSSPPHSWGGGPSEARRAKEGGGGGGTAQFQTVQTVSICSPPLPYPSPSSALAFFVSLAAIRAWAVWR